MDRDTESRAFWEMLDELAACTEVVVDRPAGTRHPRFETIIYPLNYGYLEGTKAVDGGGVDVWRGSMPGRKVTAVIATVDMVKRDTELKLLIGCNPDECRTVHAFHNEYAKMRGLLMLRPS